MQSLSSSDAHNFLSIPSHDSASHHPLPSQARLCILCLKRVPGCSLPPTAPLPGPTFLFCGGKCEDAYAARYRPHGLRRALARLEHGVCVLCGTDCRALCRRLQAIARGSKGWRKARSDVIEAFAPRFLRNPRHGRLVARLVDRAEEGNAWQADHIVPVYRGGGECEVENLRTLCTCCHAEVTAQQSKERAAERRKGVNQVGAGGGRYMSLWHCLLISRVGYGL